MPNVTGIALLITGDVITQTRIQAIMNAGSRAQVAADAAALAALTPTEGDQAFQSDTDALYTGNGATWVAAGISVASANTWTAAQTMGATGVATADTAGNEYASYAWVFRSSNWISGAAANRDIKLQAEPVTGADTYQLAVLDNAGAYLGAVRSDGKWYIGSTLDAYIQRSGVGHLQISGNLTPVSDTKVFGSASLRWQAHLQEAYLYKAAGDAQPSIMLDSGGFVTGGHAIAFGPGGASGVDTWLQRSAANQFEFNATLLPSTDAARLLGSAAKRWDFAGRWAKYYGAVSDANPRIQANVTAGQIDFGAGGASAVDVNLYRTTTGGAGTEALKTDDLMIFSGIGAKAYHNTAQSINDSTLTALSLNSERWDTDTIHDNSTNNSRLTCKTAGKYLITGCVEWQDGGAGARVTWIRLNGATKIAEYVPSASTTVDLAATITTVYNMAVNDYVELIAYQDSGGALNVQNSPNGATEFMMVKVG